MPFPGTYVPDQRSWPDSIQHAVVRQRLDPFYAADDDALSIAYYNHWLLADFTVSFQGEAPASIGAAKALFNELSGALWDRYLVDFDTINKRLPLGRQIPDSAFRRVDPITGIPEAKLRHQKAADRVAADRFSFSRDLTGI